MYCSFSAYYHIKLVSTWFCVGLHLFFLLLSIWTLLFSVDATYIRCMTKKSISIHFFQFSSRPKTIKPKWTSIERTSATPHKITWRHVWYDNMEKKNNTIMYRYLKDTSCLSSNKTSELTQVLPSISESSPSCCFSKLKFRKKKNYNI